MIKHKSFADKALNKRGFWLEEVAVPIVALCIFALAISTTWYMTKPKKPKLIVESITWTLPDNPPTNLIINGSRWTLIQYDYKNDKKFNVYDGKGQLIGHVGAETDCTHNEIFYDPLLSKSLLRDNMWHEVTHAMLCGEDDKKMEAVTDQKLPHDHYIVYTLGTSGASFIHDNPEFMKWMEDWK